MSQPIMSQLITEIGKDGRVWGKSSRSGNGGNCLQATVWWKTV